MTKTKSSSGIRIAHADIAKLVMFTGVGCLILFFLWRHMNAGYIADCAIKGIPDTECNLFKKLVTDYRSANVYWLLATCLAFMISNFLRAFRWQMLYQPLGYRPHWLNAIGGVMIAYFVNLGIPRAGEFARAGVMTKYESIPFEISFGTIITDRILDFFVLVLLLGLGFLFHAHTIIEYISLNSLISAQVLYISIAIFSIFTVIGLFFIKKIIALPEHRLSPLNLKLKGFVVGFWQGLTSVLKIPNWPGLVFYSLMIWILYVVMHVLAFYAYAPTSHLGLIEGLLVFDFGVLGIIFPSPGGMGTYHAMVSEGLQIVGVDPVSAFSWAMMTFFTVNVACNVVFGLLSMILLPWWNGRKTARCM